MFISPENAMSINRHTSFSLLRIIISALLLGVVLSVFSCLFHNVFTLFIRLVSTGLVQARTSVSCQN